MMENLLDFLAGNICILFFVNGLAFFAVGLAIALESHRVKTFAMSNSLLFLAGFGFVASVGNWFQMFHVGLSHASSVVISPLGQTLKLIVFVLTSTLLLEFGLRLAIAHDARYRRLRPGFWGLLAAYLIVVVIMQATGHRFERDWISVAEIWARYLLYSPALALAGLALLAQRRDFVGMGLFVPARDAMGAALAFGLKLIVSGLMAVPILGPSGPAASAGVLLLQFVRTLTTVAIAYFVVRILRVFEIERRQQLQQEAELRARAQEKALEAQRQSCDEIRTWSASMADMVQTVSSAISEPLEIDEIMKIVLRETLGMAGLQLGIVQLLDEKEQMLYRVAHQGVPEWFAHALGTVKVGDGLSGWVAEKGEMLIVNDVLHDPRPFVPRTEEVHRFYTGIPLKAGGKVLGVMNLLHPEEYQLTDQQMALLEVAGQQLGVAIEDARLHAKLRSMAAMEERVRLSRELHDSLAQVMGYLNLKNKTVQNLLASNEVLQALGELRDMEDITGQAYDDVRDSISALRVRVFPDTALISALEKYISQFGERSGIEVTLETPADTGPFFAPDTAIQVLRIVQEALTNVRRHAQATRAWVTFKVDGHRATIVIRDDGRGFDVSRVDPDRHKHLGLLTMRERTESVGGSLWIDSQVGRGTRIELSLPLNRERRQIV